LKIKQGEKLVKKQKRGLQAKIRVCILLILGVIVLRRPFLWVMRLFPHYFDYAFFVYPGQSSDIGGYLPESFENKSWCKTQIFFGGIITSPQGESVGRGILIGSPSTVRSMVKSSDDCKVLEQRMRQIAKGFSLKRVALAGRAPSIFLHNDVPLDNPFVHGRKGMVFCTIETLYSIARKQQIVLTEVNIIVFGAGDVGKSISDFLLSEGYTTKSIRAKTVFNDNDQQLPETVKDVLEMADIIIVISASGSDFHPYMRHLKDGAIIIGETHPPIKRSFPRGTICRAAVAVDGLRFVPSLKSYSDTCIPGCVVEAIVFSHYGDIKSQKQFNEKAREIGFRGNMI